MADRSAYDDRGFTLMELIVALVILSVMFMFALPQFPTAPGGDRVLLQKLAARVAYLKERSSRERALYTMELDKDSGSVRIAAKAPAEPEMPPEKGEKVPGPISFQDTEIVDVVFRTERPATDGEEDEDLAVIRFYPGGYSDWVAIHLQDDEGKRFSLVIEPFLAEASIRDGFHEFEE